MSETEDALKAEIAKLKEERDSLRVETWQSVCILYDALKAEIAKLKEERDSLRYATGLLNSMVLGRESHTDTSRKIVKDAMMGKKTE